MAIAYGGRAGTTSGATQASSATVTTSATIPAGSLIVVSVQRANINSLNDLTSVTDSAGNTYVSAAFKADGGQNVAVHVWYCKNAAQLTSGGTVTINGLDLLANGESYAIAVDWITGHDTTTPLDATAPAKGQGNASPWATPSFTATSANTLHWGIFGTNQNEPSAVTNANSTPSSGWTFPAAVSAGGGAGNFLRTGYQVFSTSAARAFGGTLTPGNQAAYMLLAFVAASGTTVNGDATVGGTPGGIVAVSVAAGSGTTGGTTGGLVASSVAAGSASAGGTLGGLVATSQALGSASAGGTLGGVLAASVALSGATAGGATGGLIIAAQGSPGGAALTDSTPQAVSALTDTASHAAAAVSDTARGLAVVSDSRLA